MQKIFVFSVKYKKYKIFNLLKLNKNQIL